MIQWKFDIPKNEVVSHYEGVNLFINFLLQHIILALDHLSKN